MNAARHIDVAPLPRMDNRNGWLEILPPLPPANVATGSHAFDYVVIGGGFTGLAAARRLAELNPDSSVCLIDAGRIGNNAAGRCSGFAIDQAHNIRATDFAVEIESEKNQITLNRAGQDYLRDVVQTHDIDCDWREQGKVHGAATPRGQELLKAYSGNLDLLGAEYEHLDATRMKQITGTNFYTAGLFTPGTILIQPAALVRGLAETMPANVTVFEDSPVTAIDYDQVQRLRTASAVITAPTVILANNGFASRFGFYDDHIIPISTFGSLTRQMTDEEIAILGGEISWGIIPADPFGTSVRRTADNRILIRNIYSYSPDLNSGEDTRLWARGKHERSFRNRFPMLPKLELEYTWGGPLALSRNGAPVFGKLADRVFASACHNGVGIARGTICGKLIAEDVSGQDSGLLQIMRNAARPSKLLPAFMMHIGIRANFAVRRMRAGREL